MTSTRAKLWLAISATLALCGLAMPVLAEAVAPVPGLAGLSDDKVMTELSDRGLETLLNRYFEVNKTPDATQKAMRTLGALTELADPNLKISNTERQRRIKQVVDGLPAALPNLNDPAKLEAYAAILLEQGVQRDANTLEYWGDDPVVEARLKPVADGVQMMLKKAAGVARQQADKMANQIRGDNDPNARLWESMDNLANAGLYRQNMSAYYQAMAVDASTPAGKAERARIADAAITYLSDFDNNDSMVQATVRVMIGKLNLVKGDLATAKTVLDSVFNDPQQQIKPPPAPEQKYDARYFELVADVLSKDLAAAKAGVEELAVWRKQALPQDKTVQDGVAAAEEMLRYRIFNAESALASNDADRKKADQSAIEVLDRLQKARPDLAPIIFEQIIGHLKPTDPVAGFNPLLLQGLMNRALGESNKPEGQKFDTKIVDRGIEAAKEIVTRANREGISAQLNDDALLVIPTLLDREDKKMGAASAYLDYADKCKTTHLDQAKEAVDRAGALIFDTRKNNPTDVELGPVYDRFMPLAISPPFGHTELAYAYGRRLQTLNHPVEAAKYLRMVAANDPNYFNAQYNLMLALQESLDLKLSPADRTRTIADLQDVGQAVQKLGGNSAKADERGKAAHAGLIAAQLAVSEPSVRDPKRALQLLGQFEQQVKGLPQEEQLLGAASFVRVKAFLDLKQGGNAAQAVVGLFAQRKGDEGVGLVRKVLDELDQDFKKAQANGDMKGMRDAAANKAQLTGFLVDWSARSTNPSIQKLAYQYRVYDANTKREAGTLQDEPAQRQKDLAAAEAGYNDLLSPAGHQQYVAQLDPKKVKDQAIDPTLPDPAAQVGQAFVLFEEKKYSQSLAILGDLLGNRRLGSPQIQEPGPDGMQLKTNDTYWEATTKWYEGSIALAKQGGPDAKQILDGSRRGLKQILILGGIPDRYAPEFEAMRKDILPDFDPAALQQNKVAATPAAAATPSNSATVAKK